MGLFYESFEEISAADSSHIGQKGHLTKAYIAALKKVPVETRIRLMGMKFEVTGHRRYGYSTQFHEYIGPEYLVLKALEHESSRVGRFFSGALKAVACRVFGKSSYEIPDAPLVSIEDFQPEKGLSKTGPS